MRDLTKNLFSFSWAMSLFGAKQVGRLLDPREVLKGAPGTARAFENVTSAMLEQFGESLRKTFEAGDRVQEEIVDAVFGAFGLRPGRAGSGGAATPSGLSVRPPIFDARSDAGEEVMITYTRGEGRFSDDKRYIALHNQLFNLDGRPNGLHQGVWEALFSQPQELLDRPAPPVGPMDRPVGPVPKVPLSANTIAKWTHADGSSISSVGPAASHLIPLSDGSFLFLVITAQIITEGTGRFAGANGLTQSLGATWIQAGVDLFSSDGPSTFPATTLDTFKFVTEPGSGSRSRSGGRDGGGAGSGSGSGGTRANTSGRAAGRGAACSFPGGPESRYADVLGSRMHYVEVGRGEPVVFVHGNPTWSYVWRNVLPHVSSSARCIAVDLIGMGLSDKPDIEYTFFDHVRYFDGFVENLGLEGYTLVLHDQGCLIGFFHAMEHETSVRGLAFMEALLQPYATWSDFPRDLVPAFKAYRNPEIGYKLIIEDNVFIEKQLPEGTVAELSEEVMDCYRLPFLDPPSRKVIQEFALQLPIGGEPPDVAEATGRYAAWLKRTELPKLYLWAQPGLISTKKDVDWARKNYKNLKTSFLGEGIHFFQESHPVEIGQEVSRWLESST